MDDRLCMGALIAIGVDVGHHIVAKFLFVQERRFKIDLNGVPCIGDSLRDLQAAARVQAQPILVLTGKGRLTAAAGGLPANTQTFADLDHAVKSIAP